MLDFRRDRGTSLRIDATAADPCMSKCLRYVYNTRAMIRIRHLLARRLTNPAVAALLLLVVAFRLLLPPGLLLAPNSGADGIDLAICSGHGPLFNLPVAHSDDLAAQAAAADLAHALTSSTHRADPQQHAGDLCPFSAALAIGLVSALPVPAHWLRTAAGGCAAPADDIPTATAPARGPLGARAPPPVFPV
ncbi:hypothetical protein [Burkholderia vietnamiensis]|uniref:hypothetical protein n=1 Tax=Burkholderia vietnamiensis TaxID=60552 RepID=UPI001B99FE6D|nr:hypothetical protein [Burkholderia vietnamiensis]MBR8215494.1 hypothetical protein [Burkholderia vietnamiensis]HDV8349160.1 hypothetical protein [Burkholderia vietnamiensis]